MQRTMTVQGLRVPHEVTRMVLDEASQDMYLTHVSGI